MAYDIEKDLPGQKEKLWKVLVDWCRGVRMYAEIEISDYNSKFLYSELADQKLRSNFLSLYNKHQLLFLTKKLFANDIREIRGRLLVSIMEDFCNIKNNFYKLEIIDKSFSEFISSTKEFSKVISVKLGKRFLIEINGFNYKGKVSLDEVFKIFDGENKQYIDYAFFDINSYQFHGSPFIEGKRLIEVQPIGPTLKLSLDRKILDYSRKKISERKIKDLSIFSKDEILNLKENKGKIKNINNKLYKMKNNNDIFEITILSEVSSISNRDSSKETDIFEIQETHKNIYIPKVDSQETELLNKERNKEITKCKDNILTYMKTKMSKDRRKILSLLASKQYGLKEISEILDMDYGKVRKERSFANKELREAFPECYQIFAKKRGENK
ncbi:hypothetical protein OA100_00485 [Alphaproteobacteria bacterium]|nr:hypothetical protein [Alphaproteobacteria bacterium]